MRSAAAAANTVEMDFFIPASDSTHQLLICNAHGGDVGSADSLNVFTLRNGRIVDILAFPLEPGRTTAQRLALPDNGAVEYRLQVRNSRGDVLVGLNEVRVDDEVCRVGELCADSDGDGIYNRFELKADSDKDGLEDAADDDDDNDRVATIDEGSADSDGDGIKDYLDNDSDNDGVNDGGDIGRLNPCLPVAGAACAADVDSDGLSAQEELERGAANVQITESLQQTGGVFIAGTTTIVGDADVAEAAIDIGDVAFADLTLLSPRTVIGPRTVLRVNGTFTANGTTATPLEIVANIDARAGEQLSILANGVNVDHVAVGDSLNLREAPIVPADFTDLGNNTRWGDAIADLCTGFIAVRGDVTLENDDAVVAFNASGVQCVTGDVVMGVAVTAVVLGHLQIIGGTLRVSGTQVVILELSNLDSAGGIVIEDNTQLTDVVFTSLDAVDNTIIVSGNTQLDELDFPELGLVGGDLEIDNNPALGAVDAPALTSVGGELAVTDNATLGGLTLLLLTSAGAIEITGNDALIALVLALLAQVDGTVSVTNNGALTVLTLLALASVGGDLEISGNDALEVVSVGSASVGGDLLIDEGVLPDSLCGDGRRFSGEACDDGNDDSGDGCDDGCDVEVGFVSTGTLDARSTCRGDGDGDGLADEVDRCPVSSTIRQTQTATASATPATATSTTTASTTASTSAPALVTTRATATTMAAAMPATLARPWLATCAGVRRGARRHRQARASSMPAAAPRAAGLRRGGRSGCSACSRCVVVVVVVAVARHRRCWRRSCWSARLMRRLRRAPGAGPATVVSAAPRTGSKAWCPPTVTMW